MDTGETITRIGRTFKIVEQLGVRYYQCDRCTNAYESVHGAAKCCADTPDEIARARKLEQSIRYAEKRMQRKTSAVKGLTPGAEKPSKRKSAKIENGKQSVTDHARPGKTTPAKTPPKAPAQPELVSSTTLQSALTAALLAAEANVRRAQAMRDKIVALIEDTGEGAAL